MEYYFTLKRKEILKHAIWMNFEFIVLNLVSQSLKDQYCMIPLHEVPRVVKFIETESRMAVARGWRKGGNGESAFNGYRVSFGKGEMFWRWIVVMDSQQCEYTYYHRTVLLKVVKMVNFMYIYIYF